MLEKNQEKCKNNKNSERENYLTKQQKMLITNVKSNQVVLYRVGNRSVEQRIEPEFSPKE